MSEEDNGKLQPEGSREEVAADRSSRARAKLIAARLDPPVRTPSQVSAEVREAKAARTKQEKSEARHTSADKKAVARLQAVADDVAGGRPVAEKKTGGSGRRAKYFVYTSAPFGVDETEIAKISAPQMRFVVKALKDKYAGTDTKFSMKDMVQTVAEAGLKTVQANERVVAWYKKAMLVKGWIVEATE